MGYTIAMNKTCDHTSVGMLVRDGDLFLLIERATFPFGFALPAGHVDGDPSFEAAARRELREEVGLETATLKELLDKHMDNPCRREGGTWHHWKASPGLEPVMYDLFKELAII